MMLKLYLKAAEAQETKGNARPWVTNPGIPFLVKDYESEEFLGDALLEPYVISTGYKIFKKKGVKMTPELLH